MRIPARLCATLAAGSLLVLSGPATAGEQKYEPLSASVRAALHHSVADLASPRLAFTSEAEGNAWIGEMSRRLSRHVPDAVTREDLLTTVHYEATRAGLDPQMVLGVIEVESRFRKFAVSRAGARGYMQVMPFWVKLIGDANQNLFNLRTNLRYGCTILRHYLDLERGDTFRASAAYNGTLGQARYRQSPARMDENWDYSAPGVIITPTRAGTADGVSALAGFQQPFSCLRVILPTWRAMRLPRGS
jgi:soluble lytic murein transglycosylase-like protein